MGDSGVTKYILGTEERRRLELLQQCLDPMTNRSLDAIGVEPGWRCLELGAGAGSVAQILCRRVGAAGRVVAVDRDTRFLDELAEGNLDVDRRDVLADGLPGGGYELAHARLLLMHLATREKFVGEMAAALRPGGWLLIEDMDTFPFQTTLSEGVFCDVMRKIDAAFVAANAAPAFGRQLGALFDAAGLEAVEAACEINTFRGGSPTAEMYLASAQQLRPALLAVGATEDQLEDLVGVLSDPTRWFSGLAFYSVRGRVPAR